MPSKSGHLVVCEQGEALAEVIAANYAYALRAGLYLIPDIGRELSDELLEDFYSLYDDQSVSPGEGLRNLRGRLRALTGTLPVPERGSITFITGGLPLGFSVPETPSTHLFKYPDLGIAMINGFAAEQPDRPGIGFVSLVDPQTTEANEIAAAERLLPPRGAFIRSYYGPGANVRDVTTMMELLPYDLMIIATHCGDVDGFRSTYEFTDSEGINRNLVVDIAIGVGQTDDANMLSVTQFTYASSRSTASTGTIRQRRTRFMSGTPFSTISTRRGRALSPMKPVKKRAVPRVVRSSALKMHDHNLIVLPPGAGGRTDTNHHQQRLRVVAPAGVELLRGRRPSLCRHPISNNNVRGTRGHYQVAGQTRRQAAAGSLMVGAAEGVQRRPPAPLRCRRDLSATATH